MTALQLYLGPVVFRALNAVRRAGAADKTRAKIIEIIKRSGPIKLEQPMMVRFPELHNSPQLFAASGLLMPAVYEDLCHKFGTNADFVEAMTGLLKKGPEMTADALQWLDKLFIMARENGVNCRELIPALHWWVTDSAISNVPEHPKELMTFFGLVWFIMKSGGDPVRELMLIGLHGKIGLPLKGAPLPGS